MEQNKGNGNDTLENGLEDYCNEESIEKTFSL